MAEPSRITTLTVPLFSSDYAKKEREIAEWNRRARVAFSAIDAEFSRLSSGVGVDSPIATSSDFGTVKTDITVSNPVVYLKASIDALIASLQSQISSGVQYVHVQLTPLNPWVVVHGRTILPGGIRIMTTPDYREIVGVPTDDSVAGQTTISFGYNVAGIAILVFS